MSTARRLYPFRTFSSLLLVAVLFVGLASPSFLVAGSLETANVMAPLQIHDNEWDTFKAQLATVKSYGVDAVSVDVWWGATEASGDNKFEWSYYDKLFSTIKASGLKIVPILSFHQCSSANPGNSCDVPLPPWLWTKYIGKTFNGIQINDTDLEYKSERGQFSQQTVQLWADALVANEYVDFVTAFTNHFLAYSNDFIEINVSAGPSGELRYPSYDTQDTNYPSRGALQSYSRLAVEDFQAKMLKKYGDLAGINTAWGINLASNEEIQPPSQPDFFFSHGDYKNIQYGKDFVDWYNQSLVGHGKSLISTVIAALGTSFPSAKIGYKIPGVHWAMTNPAYPRAAEVAAGLIQTSVDLNSDATGHGYANIVGLAKTLMSPSRGIVLHFTCLEMDDENFRPPYSYSLAKSLVFWVANEAQRQGVTIKGENALADGITNDGGWNNIDNAFSYASYIGLTTLRIGEVASGGTGQSRYSAFIQKFRPAAFPSLYIRGTNNNWGTVAMSKSGTVWSLNNVVFGNTSTERFKFDVRGDWSENYGGDGLSGPAIRGGKDIAVQSRKTYNISFDEVSKTFIVASAAATDTWYFRGTPNHWGTTAMTQVGSSDVFKVVISFANEDPSPRFKIDHFGDWKENYPAQDDEVANCTSYEISFNRANKQIDPERLSDVTMGTCAQQNLSLGVTYGPQATTFSVWSPDSANVQLWLDGALHPMASPGGQGLADVYTVTIPGDQHLKRYHFQVNGHTARDPYGVMVDPGPDPATQNNVVVNMALTEPAGGWTPRPPLKAREDSVIYEVHVRDFTIDPSSGVDGDKRGKFLGMVQAGTTYQGRATGLDHLKDLGITHVQILPFFDFRSCSNALPSCYNWGYDPLNFNVPEERYSLHPDDPVERIRELKTMINEFHKAGIRVIMDVVYNHTADRAWAESTFSPITSQYFLGTDLSGTGNSVDDRKPMVSRLIRDSLGFWVREYHVDGFRFDLMGIFDYAEVGNWARYLNQQFPDAMLLIYGEPWSAGSDPQERDRVRLGTLGRIVDAHVGAFNDQYRNALKGDNDSGAGGGYIFNQGDHLFSIRVGSRGAIRYTYDPWQVLPNLWDQMFANDPEQTINYVSAHDNLILRDKILLWADKTHTTDQAYLKRIQEFADGIILTSQGIPFIEAGDEMLRDKQRNTNSFEAPDSVNEIHWQWKIDNADVFDYHRQVIALRKSHPGFRMTSWDQINTNCQTNEKLRYGVVVNRINAKANGDQWPDVIVIYNSADNYDFTLPSGTWFVAMEKSDPSAGKDRPVTGKITAEGTAVTVVHR